VNKKAGIAAFMIFVLLVSSWFVLVGGDSNQSTDETSNNMNQEQFVNETDTETSDTEEQETSPQNSVETPDYYPEGLYGGGRINSEQLIANHRSVVSGNTIKVSVVSSSEGAERNIQYQEGTGDSYYKSVSSSGTFEAYNDGEYTYKSRQDGTYDLQEQSEIGTKHPKLGLLSSAIQSTTTENISEKMEGSSRVITVERELVEGLSLSNANSIGYSDISSLNVELEIKESGLIRSADISIEGFASGSDTEEDYMYNIENVGGVSANKPNWLNEARSGSVTISTEYSNTNGWIKLSRKGLGELPRGTRIEITDSSANTTAVTLPEKVGEQDVYLYKKKTGWKVNVGSTPSISSVEVGDSFIVEGYYRGQQVFSKIAS
jgi:hypothetical protein